MTYVELLYSTMGIMGQMNYPEAMIVAYSCPIAIKMYKKILELRPDWYEKVKVVMSGSNKEPEEWNKIIGDKTYKKDLIIFSVQIIVNFFYMGTLYQVIV